MTVVNQDGNNTLRIQPEKLRTMLISGAEIQLMAASFKVLFAERDANLLCAGGHIVVIQLEHRTLPCDSNNGATRTQAGLSRN